MEEAFYLSVVGAIELSTHARNYPMQHTAVAETSDYYFVPRDQDGVSNPSLGFPM